MPPSSSPSTPDPGPGGAGGEAAEPPPSRLRPATPEDRAFLLELYATTRADEMALVPWTDAEKAAFVEMQFEAQDRAYRSNHPDGRFLVVVAGAEPIGRLILARLPGELRVVDVALLPVHRGRGIGTRLIRDVQAEAAEAGFAVRLHVETWNPAAVLYERLGFRAVELTGIHLLMEWHPPLDAEHEDAPERA